MFEGGLRVKMESIDSSFHFRQPQCEYGNRIIVIVMMDSVPVFQQVLKISQEPEAETEWIIFPFLVLVGSTVHAEKRYHVLLKNQTIGK